MATREEEEAGRKSNPDGVLLDADGFSLDGHSMMARWRRNGRIGPPPFPALLNSTDRGEQNRRANFQSVVLPLRDRGVIGANRQKLGASILGSSSLGINPVPKEQTGNAPNTPGANPIVGPTPDLSDSAIPQTSGRFSNSILQSKQRKKTVLG